MHLTVGVFGDPELAKRLGKQGTINDIALYNHGSGGDVITFAAPNSAENRIQPLLQVLGMIDVPVVACPDPAKGNEGAGGHLPSKELAEQMIAIDACRFSSGFLLSPSPELKSLIKGTSLEGFVVVEDERELRESLKSVDPEPLTDKPWIPIDNYFTVRSVGTVVLSVNKGRPVKRYDKLSVQPLGKEVLVKGIQSQDKDVEEVAEGMRAGINLKGVEADELRRGFVLCREASVSRRVRVRFRKSPFSREPPAAGMQYYLSVGLQVIAGRIEEASGEELSVMLEHPAAFLPGLRCVLASTKPAMPRILGSGTMA
jgi:selenocysteine-specific translation elongation factor